MAKSKKNKNKGPKGKKARAKAKLERQWGEIENNNASVKVPRGQKHRQRNQKLKESVFDDNDDEMILDQQQQEIQHDDNDDDEKEEEEEEEGQDGVEALDSLMSSIRQRSKRKHDISSRLRQKRDFYDEIDIDDDDEMNEEEISANVGDESDSQQKACFAISSLSSLLNSHKTMSMDDTIFQNRFQKYNQNDSIPIENNDAFQSYWKSQTMPLVPFDLAKYSNKSSYSLPPYFDFQVSRPYLDSITKRQTKDDNDNNHQESLVFTHMIQQSLHFFTEQAHHYRSNLQQSFLDKSIHPYHAMIHHPMAHYMDMLIIEPHYSQREQQLIKNNITTTTNLLQWHILNHVLTSRQQVLNHNKRLAKQQGGDGDKQPSNHNEIEYRDQGFTRPTVLIILPTRGACYTFVKDLLSQLSSSSSSTTFKQQQQQEQFMDRFHQEYGPPEEEDNNDTTKEAHRRRRIMQAKGQEWNQLWGDQVNTDDDFRLGLAVTPNGNALRLYTDFYKSDFIVASPLALKSMLLDQQDDDENGESQNVDFLSSIEICLIDHADVIFMQNWDHLTSLFTTTTTTDDDDEFLNARQPKSIQHTDFARVRNYFLEGKSKFWRQCIVRSQFLDPSIWATWKRHCAKSLAGQACIIPRTISHDDEGTIVPISTPSLDRVVVATPQIFTRLSQCTSFTNVGKARVEYLSQHILPRFFHSSEEQRQTRTLLFIPSYFDFIAIRNILLRQEFFDDYVTITEYSRTSEVSRARARFFHGQKALMLYTGRAHFFQRHAIRGIRHLIFVGLPEYPDYYAQLVNQLALDQQQPNDDDDDMDEEFNKPSCLVLYTKYEAMALERIVGRSNCERMLQQGTKESHMFVA